MVPETFDARVVHTRPLSPSVREIGFARVDGAPFDFEPGQWVSVILEAHAGDPLTEVRRAYSVASPPRGDPSFELAVTRVTEGAASNALHALPVGAVVRVIGPQGFFTRPLETAAPSLLIGTGTGLAPLRSMLLSAVRARPHASERVPMWLLFGGRQEHDLLYGDELAALAATDDAVRVEQALSRASDAWRGRRGYVQAHARELYEELARSVAVPPHVYVCGLERMVGAVRTLLRKEMGLPRQLVHSERYD